MPIQQMFLGLGGALPMEATGGNTVSTVTIGGTDYKLHTFTSNGTFAVTTGGTIDALLVGGGGGGGEFGGGGGGGAVIHIQTKPLDAGSYSVVIGDGGDGSVRDAAVTATHDGDTTTFNGYSATGGGAGGSYDNRYARAGANGGGSGRTHLARITGVAPSDTDAYDTVYAGYTGGIHTNNATENYPCGGGAGAGGNGGDGPNGSTRFQPSGPGGVGVQINIDGNNYYWAGGGGGSKYDERSGGAGGTGGGGGGAGPANGGAGFNSGSNGVAISWSGNSMIGGQGGDGGANTGGGGGGSVWGGHQGNGGGQGGDGGSGIVMIRYEA